AIPLRNRCAFRPLVSQTNAPARYRETAAGVKRSSTTAKTGTPSLPRVRITPTKPWCRACQPTFMTRAGTGSAGAPSRVLKNSGKAPRLLISVSLEYGYGGAVVVGGSLAAITTSG